MMKVSTLLERMDGNLGTMIALSQKTNGLLESLLNAVKSIEEPVAESIQSSASSSVSPEAKLFSNIAEVYRGEEVVKVSTGLKRKGARRVALQLYDAVADTLAEMVPGLDFEVDRNLKVIVCTKDGKAEATLRFFTDLGYFRGVKWYNEVSNVVRQVVGKYRIPKERVYFLIGSLGNGIDHNHIKFILGKSIPGNKEFLNDPSWRPDVDAYVTQYVAGTNLPDPPTQCFFLGAGLHPNEVGVESYQSGKGVSMIISQSAVWLRPSVTELVHELEQI